jgi:Integrase core domain
MGLTMSERKAVTKATATRYARSDKTGKAKILDELRETTGWHRDHARKALRTALRPKVVKPRAPRPPKYGPNVIAALVFCWAVLGMPAGKRLAPTLADLVAVLRSFEELIVDDDTALLVVGMSVATIDRRLGPERKKHQLKGRSLTKPGSLLKSQIPIRTWAQWDDAVPGFVEIDLVGHEGGNAVGEHAYTLTVTDIATGWTENQSVRNKAQVHVFAAIRRVVENLPFPIRGIDSDNGSEFINAQLFRYCQDHDLKFTRSRSGNNNDGAHVEGEELDCRAAAGGLPAIRHRSRTVATQQDLGATRPDRQPLLPSTEADLQGPRRCQDHQEVRHGEDPLRPHHRPHRPQGTAETTTTRTTRHVQPCRCPEADPGAGR